MAYRYFPGCTLHEQARGFDLTARQSCEALGLNLVELENWQCCGAVFPLATDALINLVAPYRTLAATAAAGADLITLCSGCLNVLRRTNRLVAADREVQAKLHAFVEEDYGGQREVLHLLEVFRRDITFDAIRSRVTLPLTGLRVAPYYGCLLLRPPEDMRFDDPEDPVIMEDFLRALGAEPVASPLRTECCGAYLSLRDGGRAAATAVLQSAAGADLMLTTCPTCCYSLEQAGAGLPVVYFTQLLALALGLDGHFERHAVDPRPVLRKKSLLAEVS